MQTSSQLDPSGAFGTTGYDDEEYIGGIKSHIPGYAGYIPKIRAENIFGKTYGKATHLSKTRHTQQTFDLGPEPGYIDSVYKRERTGPLAGPLNDPNMKQGVPPDQFYLMSKSKTLGKTSDGLLRETHTDKPKPELNLSVEELKKIALSQS